MVTDGPPDATLAQLADDGEIYSQVGQQAERLAQDPRWAEQSKRFLLALPRSGHTILIAHNIDLAPRIPELRRGDRVGFKGEYEWNERGGVVHWTHHDPRKSHEEGWIRHEGKTYE